MIHEKKENTKKNQTDVYGKGQSMVLVDQQSLIHTFTKRGVWNKSTAKGKKDITISCGLPKEEIKVKRHRNGKNS